MSVVWVTEGHLCIKGWWPYLKIFGNGICLVFSIWTIQMSFTWFFFGKLSSDTENTLLERETHRLRHQISKATIKNKCKSPILTFEQTLSKIHHFCGASNRNVFVEIGFCKLQLKLSNVNHLKIATLKFGNTIHLALAMQHCWKWTLLWYCGIYSLLAYCE